MVKPVESYTALLDQHNVDVWAVGPGLGTNRADQLLQLIERADKPMVIDADGLNMVPKKVDILNRCRGPRLITPHPGEMKRLFDVGKMSRAEIARRFCEQFAVTLLFKGSRTIVSERDRALSFNSTGNPGMAAGGTGDVLTGVCAGLLGRNDALRRSSDWGAGCADGPLRSRRSNRVKARNLFCAGCVDHLGSASTICESTGLS